MSIKLQIGDRLWPDGMSISQPLRVAAFPTDRAAALVGEHGEVSLFTQQSDGTWLCDLGADSGGRYWSRIDHRTVFEPTIESATDATLALAAYKSFAEVCRHAGMEPTEERWLKMKAEFVKDEHKRREKMKAKERAGHFAEKRRAFLTALNALVEQMGCYIDHDPHGDGISIVSPGDENETHIDHDHRTGFYIEVGSGRTSPEPRRDSDDDGLIGVEDDEL
mgnify:CR=1 FL=1